MRTSFIILIMALLAAGCSHADSASHDARTDMPSIKGVQSPSASASYSALRKRLLLDGWLPLQNAGCAEDANRPLACNRWLELQRCDTAGRCSMAWGDAAGQQIMQVQVSGMPPKDSGALRTADLKLVGSEQAPARGEPAAATRCPGTDFATFLPAFASQAAIRQAFTAPLVRAKVLISDGDGDRTEEAYVRGNQPDVFDVVYRDGAFHHLGVDGIDPAPLRLEIRQPSADVRDVSYLYGSSEGRGFRFTRRGGCWHLTGNPEPTGP
jgi:hypothetical protein